MWEKRSFRKDAGGRGVAGRRKKVAEEAVFSCNNGFASKNARALSKTVVLCVRVYFY